jgi:nitrite reductase/ring-hydroxylating ferredoxin subunit
LNKEKKYKWHKIAGAIDELGFNSANLIEVEIEGKRICIGKGNSGLHACSAKCPHAGGIMATGEVDSQDNIVCPLHRYKFSLANGRNVSGEGYYLKTYPVEIRPEGIFVGIEESSFNWLK